MRFPETRLLENEFGFTNGVKRASGQDARPERQRGASRAFRAPDVFAEDLSTAKYGEKRSALYSCGKIALYSCGKIERCSNLVAGRCVRSKPEAGVRPATWHGLVSP